MTNHTCPYCESTCTELSRNLNEFWCHDCQRWDDTGDQNEQSRDEIARDEIAAIDNQERR